MNWKIWIVALTVLSLGATAADAKKHRRHFRPPPEAAAPAIWPYWSRYQEPAHFVRLPNGLIVSSYECFYDEGYGRYLACGAGKR